MWLLFFGRRARARSLLLLRDEAIHETTDRQSP
jgi:hypothetical protein